MLVWMFGTPSVIQFNQIFFLSKTMLEIQNYITSLLQTLCDTLCLYQEQGEEKLKKKTEIGKKKEPLAKPQRKDPSA